MNPLYVYLMSSPGREAKSGSELYFHVGVSHRPEQRIREHNTHNGAFRGAVKKTAKGCPHWKLEMVVGPFGHGANAFAKAWRQACRRRLSRISIGFLLAFYAEKLAVCRNAAHRVEQANKHFSEHSAKFKAIALKCKTLQPGVFVK